VNANTKEKIIVIIPARMGSSRFPGKPLAPILGRPMIEHVYRRTEMCTLLSGVYVATCDEEIRLAVKKFGGNVIMTSPLHQRASDRVAEAAQTLSADIVVMVQGDEPLVTPQMIAKSVVPLLERTDCFCVNLVQRIENADDFEDPNTIKVVMDRTGNAIYFSREPIPTRRILGFDKLQTYKQVCIIPFFKEMLFRFNELSPTPLEQAESIDMLRVMEHGYKVQLVESPDKTQSVDTLADLKKVEILMQQDLLSKKYL